jgi:hypothetical protein
MSITRIQRERSASTKTSAPPVTSRTGHDEQKDDEMKQYNDPKAQTNVKFEMPQFLKKRTARSEARNDDPPTTEWVLVTPPIAKDWLDRNDHNRTLSAVRVDVMARDMKQGAWRRTGEAIKFGPSGVLLDGQHRLNAIIKANVACSMLVIRGLELESQDAMDRGKRRSDADVLRISGKDNCRNRAAWIHTIDLIVNGTVRMLSENDRREIEERFATAIEWGSGAMLRSTGLKRSEVMGALVFAYQADPEKIDAFTTSLRSGANLAKGSPTLTLREHVSNFIFRHRETRRDTSLKTLRAARAYMKNESLSKLVAGEECAEFFCRIYGLNRGAK